MTLIQRGEAAGKGRRVAVVASRFNQAIVESLVEGAVSTLQARGVSPDFITVAWVPGAWEIPLAARALAARGHFDGFITLGAILQGQTTHHEHLGREVAASLMRLMDETGKPVAFGVLTCDSEEKAYARAGGPKGNKGSECAEALLEALDVLDKIRK